jgi:hypothetical protein
LRSSRSTKSAPAAQCKSVTTAILEDYQDAQ